MKKEITCKAIFNLFKMHYEDAEHFLSVAKEHKKQNKEEMEKRYSRSSILSYYFSIEALINYILYDMHNKKIFSTATLENLEKLSIHDKYLLAPLICENFSGETLDKNDLKDLNFLSCLRNDYVHSKHFKSRPITKIGFVARIFKTTEGLKEVLPEIRAEEEKDNSTGIKRNIMYLDYKDALKTKEITDWLFEKMNILLDGLILGKKGLPGANEAELLKARAGLLDGFIKTDFIVVEPNHELFKELDDYQLKAIITQLFEEKLPVEHKKTFDSLSAREKEELIVELVREFKLRKG